MPDFKSTLNLPKTDFAMKANLAQAEPQTVKRWQDEGLYEAVQSARASAPPSIILRLGTAGVLRNVLVYKTAVGVDVQDAETCAQISAGTLRLTNSLLAGVGELGSNDDDPPACGGFASPASELGWITDAANQNQTLAAGAAIDGLVKAPGSLATMDARTTSPLASIAPPNDGFFDPAAAFIGAEGYALFNPFANIPWHSGWTRGGLPTIAPTFGFVRGVVTRVQGGPVAGATVRVGTASVVTGASGAYALNAVPTGPAQFELANVPANCVAPSPVNIQVPAGLTLTRDVQVDCPPPTGTITGVVTSPTRGALNGAVVRAAGVQSSTGPDGRYTLAAVPAGTAQVEVTTAPVDCTLPSAQPVVVVGGATATADVQVSCAAPTITPSTIRLTYICGTRFRVRNPNDAVITVTWDVAGTTESGTLQLPARPLNASFSETFVTTVAVGTVRLFYHGAQVDVKANGGFTCPP